MMLNDTSSRNPASVWLPAAVAVAAIVVGAFVLIRSGSGTPVRPADEWVTAAPVEEIEERYVVYVQEHELFVMTMATVPKGFVALSASIPAQMGGGGPRKMLYCTLSNLFENEHGDVYDMAGHPLDGESGEPMSRIPLRVRNGVVEVAPMRVIRNDLDRFGGPNGPPCGEWGGVEEGPKGYAFATDAPARENRARIHPTRLKVGQGAELHFAPGRQSSGLSWGLHRLEDNGLWHWRGILVGGPGYESYFDLAPLDPSGGIDDIAFGGKYSVDIQIPKLDPGTYRLATHSVRGGSRPVYERTEWHHADFEVIPD